MALEKNLYPLTGKVQHYAWGGFHFIPALLDITNNEKKPFAEYWLGTHPLASSEVHTGHQFLNNLIEENTELTLGEYVATNFGALPYLLKILDVRDMLSIQVHPAKSEAEESFKKENEAGISLTASHRNYKDENHKNFKHFYPVQSCSELYNLHVSIQVKLIFIDILCGNNSILVCVVITYWLICV